MITDKQTLRRGGSIVVEKDPKVVSFAKKLKVDDVLTMLKFLWHL